MQVFCTNISQNVIIMAFCSACSKLYAWLCPGRECLCRGLHAFGVGCSFYVLREVAFWVRWKWFVCYGRAFFLLRGSVSLVTGERSSCYGRASFLLREADFSVGRIDFSTSRKCFSAFAQVHLSPLTSVLCILAGGFMYFHRCFYVFLQVVFCAPTSASRSLHEQLACMQAGLLPRPTLPCCGTMWWNCQVLKKRYRNLYVRNSIPLIERFCAICWL